MVTARDPPAVDRARPGARGGRVLAALCLVVTVAYGALYYGFAVLIAEPAAGSEYSRALLSAAYGGSVVTAGLAAVPVGRTGDRRGVRWVVVTGAVLGAGGLVGFAAASQGWQVLAVWWLVLGPAAAMTMYEPAYIAIQHAFPDEQRARAIATLTLAAGFSGPLFTWATGALVAELGWRPAARALAVPFLLAALVAVTAIRVGPSANRRDPSRGSGPAEAAGHEPGGSSARAAFRDARLRRFTVAAVLAYGAIEAAIVHRIARFEDVGVSLQTVAWWAAVSGLLTLPGRFLLPLLSNRIRPTTVLAIVLGVLGASTALMVPGSAYWQMVVSFGLFGLVFGAALPLRALVMGRWTTTAVFGTVMGTQAALIALGRAGLPTLTGGLRDAFDGYGVAMALLTLTLVVSVLLVLSSGRRRGGPA